MIQRASTASGAEAPADDQAAPIEPLALTAKDAARALSIGERTLWALTNSGEIPCVRIGRKVLYPVHLLREYLTELYADQGGKQHAQNKSGRRGDAGRSVDRSVGPVNRGGSID